MTATAFAPIRWVYSLKDYKALFQLSNQALNQRILEFPATVSSFNFQMTALGHEVVSASPLYALEQDAMEDLVGQAMQTLTQEQVACLGEGGVLPGELSAGMRRLRRTADIFLTDYSVGVRTGRYVFSGDSHLAITDEAYDLALCMAVDTPTDQLPALVQELTRVASEFRMIIPSDQTVAPMWLHEVLHQLQAADCQVAFKPVAAPSGNASWVMLQAKRLACLVDAA
jgi:hypothetical protein